jgi:hypothetical protein
MRSRNKILFDMMLSDDFEIDSSSKDKAYIYTLSDPITLQIRYVGKTNAPRIRFVEHLRESTSSNKRKSDWISYLQVRGLLPILDVVEEHTLLDTRAWKHSERFWIQNLKGLGCDLLNVRKGGENDGFYDEEVKLHLSRIRKGRKGTPESKAKRIATRRGRITEKMKWQFENVKAARWADPDARKRMSEKMHQVRAREKALRTGLTKGEQEAIDTALRIKERTERKRIRLEAKENERRARAELREQKRIARKERAVLVKEQAVIAKEQFRKRMSLFQKQRFAAMTPEERKITGKRLERMREAARSRSPEATANISRAVRKPRSEETKAKMKVAAKLRWDAIRADPKRQEQMSAKLTAGQLRRGERQRQERAKQITLSS